MLGCSGDRIFLLCFLPGRLKKCPLLTWKPFRLRTWTSFQAECLYNKTPSLGCESINAYHLWFSLFCTNGTNQTELPWLKKILHVFHICDVSLRYVFKRRILNEGTLCTDIMHCNVVLKVKVWVLVLGHPVDEDVEIKTEYRAWPHLKL